MPSPQIAAIILFYFQVVSGIAAAIFIGQWMRSQAKKFEGGVMISFPMKYPRLLMAMVAFSIICGVSGLWIVYHLPKPAPSPLVTPSTSASNDPTIPLYEQKADPSTILAANQLINSYLLNHPGDKVGAVAYANSELHNKGIRGHVELHDIAAPNSVGLEVEGDGNQVSDVKTEGYATGAKAKGNKNTLNKFDLKAQDSKETKTEH